MGAYLGHHGMGRVQSIPTYRVYRLYTYDYGQFISLRIPVCPSNCCTISLVCKFQMYTMLSSEPDTIHCGQQNKLQNTK